MGFAELAKQSEFLAFSNATINDTKAFTDSEAQSTAYWAYLAISTNYLNLTSPLVSELDKKYHRRENLFNRFRDKLRDKPTQLQRKNPWHYF
jgi:hypothetical protein